MRSLLLALALAAATLGMAPSPAEARLTNCGIAGTGADIYTACYSFDPATNGAAQHARGVCWYWDGNVWVGIVTYGQWVGRGQVSHAWCFTELVSHRGVGDVLMPDDDREHFAPSATRYLDDDLPPDDLIPRKVRAWVYRVLLAAQPLLIAWGAADDPKVAGLIASISAFFGFALATANTPTKESP